MGSAVTFWAMPVATRVVRLLLVATLVALDEVATKSSGATQLDGPQGSMLRAIERVPIARQEGLAMLANDISDFDLGAIHGR